MIRDYPEARYYVDIVVFEHYGDGYWAQEKYLVHGYSDVLWTSDLKQALSYLYKDIRENDIQKTGRTN